MLPFLNRQSPQEENEQTEEKVGLSRPVVVECLSRLGEEVKALYMGC